MARRKHKDPQASLPFRSWGGKREGAGRKKKPGAKLRHAARAPQPSSVPALVTLRTIRGAPNLRRSSSYAVVERAVRAANERDGFRVVHFTTQANHLHLIVEAQGAPARARGMQGLTVRIARGVNRAAGRSGKLWSDRYHARPLRSPREVRNALCYVLQNTRRHETTASTIVDPGWIDPRSSGPWFDGWKDPPPSAPPGPPPVAPAGTWLLARGWRRHGRIRVDEVPRAAFA